MLRVVLHGVRSALAFGIGEDELDRDEVVRGVECAPVGHREWFVVDGVLNGTPNVDEADASGEKAVGILGEVVVYAPHACAVCLIDVHELLNGKVVLVQRGT